MSKSRQLAAIMFTDIVGFTAMMQEDEALTLRLRDKLKKKLETEVPLHGGRIVKFSGDGALCSFDSAIQSIRVAIIVQLHMLEEPKVPLRIGVHQADVVFEDGDVHGDGVNIASRLESFAIPGSIFISAKVYDDIKNHKDIQAVSLGKYALKNVVEPVEIYSISNPGLEVPLNKKLVGKGIKYVSDKVTLRKRSLLIQSMIVLSAISLLIYFIVPPILSKQHARNKLLPAIQEMVDDNFISPTAAYDLGLEAEKYIADDSLLINLWPKISVTGSIITDPEGAEVFWKDYHTPDSAWRSAGTTPIIDARFPRGYLRMEIKKEGFQKIEYANIVWRKNGTFKLDALGSLPENMIRIPARTSRMNITGLNQVGGHQVGEFLIDRHEVTNLHFKKFMDAGGYANDSIWKFPFYSNGVEITLENALDLFVDKTGRRGPATWEAGTYPDGTENHPVTGISWYEAAAYAAHVGKRLPTVFHWSVLAQNRRTEYIVPLSNFNGKSTVPVGSMDGYSFFGAYDLAGNAREWCFNESDQEGQRYILGGGWNDPNYSFNFSYTQSSMDRSIANGFRCMKEFPGDTTIAKLLKSVSTTTRDYQKEKPVDDKTFSLYLNQYVYDDKPLESKVEQTITTDIWKVEKVTFDAGYNNERMQAWVYLPNNTKPPYQTIMYFPGSNGVYRKAYDPHNIGYRNFIMKSGRALVFPIFKGTNERHDELENDLPEETALYKDHLIMWVKEFRRTIDYLETRSDVQADKIGFIGNSWGGFMGGIVPAIENRIQAVVLRVGGMDMNRTFPEVDQINYLPRVTQPVLMLNGKYDMFFPVEAAQRPMYDLLGTPEKDKKHLIYDAGHLIPQTDFVKETLKWFDQYLGPVE